MPLVEKYRPRSWADVVGQDKVVALIRRLRERGLGGRAFWISGQSGTGKTTIGRLLAHEVADELNTEELDASDLTPARLRDIERGTWMKALGAKTGRAYLVNEAHGLRKDSIRQLLVLLSAHPAPCRVGLHHHRGRPAVALRGLRRRLAALVPLPPHRAGPPRAGRALRPAG